MSSKLTWTKGRGGKVNENGEGLPLFSLHVEPVGSLCGLFVGLLFECRPSVRLLPGKASLGRGPSEKAGCYRRAFSC